MRGWVVCTFQYLTINDSSDLFSFFKKGHFGPLLFFCIFNAVDSKCVIFKISPMTGFEPRISGIGSDRSAN